MSSFMRLGIFQEMRQARRLLIGAICVLTFLGIFWAESWESFFAYAIVTAGALAPSVLWVRIGAPGIPVLPVAAALHYIYFAVPVLRNNFDRGFYDDAEILQASMTVGLFLAVATLAWWFVLGASVRRSRTTMVQNVSNPRVVRLMFGGLTIGLLFQLAAKLGLLNGVGSYYGLIRSVALTAVSISCYLLGYCRGRGLLSGQSWRLALLIMAVVVILSFSSLYLVAGITYGVAAVLGYVITTKRVPWKMLAPVAVVLFVLHAGKGEMRERYWGMNGLGETSIENVPGLLVEWFSDGFSAIGSGSVRQDVLDRASLLYILLHVEQFTPQTVPYMGGTTYGLLLDYLTPRFLNPDKANTQAGLALLNIRYGLQTAESAQSTTIGWGIISEAFANFGYLGVMGAALVYGAITGLFTRFSAGTSPLALTTLLAVAGLVALINLEADFAYVLTNLFQSLIAAAVFFFPLKMLTGADNENVKVQQKYSGPRYPR